MTKQQVTSLFSGCGGLDIGFQQAGHDLIFANDNDKAACETYQSNLDENILCNEISSVTSKSIPDSDILIGGPPCQAFSMIGKRDYNDKNFNLIWNYLEILKTKKPEKFLIENVTGLRSATNEDGKKVMELLTRKIETLGYKVSTMILNAADYGVPQRRKRLFIMGNLGAEPLEIPKPTHTQNPTDENPLKRWVSVKEALDDLPKPSYENEVLEYKTKVNSEYQKMMRKKSKKVHNHRIPKPSKLDAEIIKYVKEGGNYMDVPDHVPSNRIKKYKITGGRTTTYGRLKRNMPAYTINTYFDRPNVGCNIHYSQKRLISIREGLRLQSFPDDFILSNEMSKREQYKLVGNAVPPVLAYAIAKSFL